jgi:hypothetical protein
MLYIIIYGMDSNNLLNLIFCSYEKSKQKELDFVSRLTTRK